MPHVRVLHVRFHSSLLVLDGRFETSEVMASCLFVVFGAIVAVSRIAVVSLKC